MLVSQNWGRNLITEKREMVGPSFSEPQTLWAITNHKLNMKSFITIALISFSISCSSYKGVIKGDRLSEFHFNGKSHNSFIENRIPDFGISGEDGCIYKAPLSFEMIQLNDSTYWGRVSESNTHNPTPAKLKIYYQGIPPKVLFTKLNGEIRFSNHPQLQKIEIDWVGMRTLSLDFTKRKLLNKINAHNNQFAKIGADI